MLPSVPIDPFIERAERGVQSEGVNSKKRIEEVNSIVPACNGEEQILAVEEQRLGPACGTLWQPCWEASPTHPSLKNTVCAAESSSPRQGVEPSSATLQSGGGAGTGAMPLGNGLPWSWQGYFWSRWSRSRGRSGAGHRHRCFAPRHGLSLSSFFMSFPGKAPGMKSNPSA